jgi:flagellin FlaB
MKRFINDNKGFTGLEAAIVLTAFVVVAAVFSYVVLGAGFFTTDTAKQVVHTGMEQATSSASVVGDVMAAGSGTNVTNITVTLQLTAGNNPVDMAKNRTIISYTAIDRHVDDLYGTNSTVTWVINETHLGISSTGDDMLEVNEKLQIELDISWFAAGEELNANEEFTIEVRTPQGAVLPVTRVIPPSVETIMNLH